MKRESESVYRVDIVPTGGTQATAEPSQPGG